MVREIFGLAANLYLGIARYRVFALAGHVLNVSAVETKARIQIASFGMAARESNDLLDAVTVTLAVTPCGVDFQEFRGVLGAVFFGLRAHILGRMFPNKDARAVNVVPTALGARVLKTPNTIAVFEVGQDKREAFV